MKLRIYVIKKKHLIWAAIILAIIIIAAVIIATRRSTNETLNHIGSQYTIKDDINNDGKIDSIVINVDEKTKEYNLSVAMSDGKGYIIEADKTIKTLGYYSPDWPMHVTVDDIDKDKVKEIIIQSKDKTGPILSIFRFNNDKFEKMASGRYQVYGLIKHPASSNNFVVLGSRNNSSMNFNLFIAKEGKLTPVLSTLNNLSLGKDTIASFIEYVEKKEVEAFNQIIDNKLTSTIQNGNFEDAKITDIKYNKDGMPTDITYLVRTSVQSNSGNEALVYKVQMSLSKVEDKLPKYTITDLNIIK
ncbi:FG-GAP repeat domain-containing protein [Thermobrachium celere]|uniref:Uncharacterized protein n=1 Tax=Thermobrachium celere DSM 8682 TaxID=941824 RepID=R7RQZ8_9CLOT|nr:VCBS repeat-containing protein [Thermobrachium celere]CDF57776.1 hypothetical protein TCEL_01690 [Thermobrachium celere DSM 8682]